MKFICLFPVLVLCCCCSTRHTKQKDNVDTDKLLSQISSYSAEDKPLLANMSDSLKKWFPVWDTIFVNDAKYRRGGSTVYFDNTEAQNKLDSLNQGLVTFFLDKYGFPARNQSGTIGLMAITKVMQHAPTAMQEKYYPMWVEAYKDNKLLGADIGLLEDRINMSRRRKQYYGTQHMQYGDGEDYLYPVVNPDSINAWREQMFRGGYIIEGTIKDTADYTIEREYKVVYKQKWDIDAYKKALPDLIKKFKVTDSPGIRFIK